MKKLFENLLVRGLFFLGVLFAVHSASSNEYRDLNAGPEFLPVVTRASPNAEHCEESYSGECRMDLQTAKDYCNGIEARLPSAKEFAIFAMSLGARGILNLTEAEFKIEYQKDPSILPYDFYNSDGSKEFFYNSSRGYDFKKFSNVNSGQWFWTSSRWAYYENFRPPALFDSGLGEFQLFLENHGHTFKMGVRCVRDR